MAMRVERRQAIVTVTNTTSDWTERGYRNIAANARSTKRVWVRQFGTADEAKVELEAVRNVRDAQKATGSKRSTFDAATIQRAAARRGQAWPARYDADEVCIRCGSDIHRGEMVCYEYARDGGHRALIHESCEAAHKFDELAGHAPALNEPY